MKKNINNIVAVLLLSMLLSGYVFGQDSPPNIVIILADDLGLGCITPYGAPASALTTPALNNLAAEGRKFTNAYTPTSMCSPSRYGLMTGRYYFRDVRDWGIIQNSDDCTLAPDRFNLASRLKNAGYNTGGIGKWHLGYDGRSIVPFPIANYAGFDYWHDYRVRPDGSEIKRGDEDEGTLDDEDINRTAEYSNDKVTEWINSQDEDTPFFLYFAPIAIHTPIIPGDLYRGKSAVYSNATNSTARQSSIVTDYIEELDGSVQNILTALENNGFTDNTIVIFTSDNGAVNSHTRALRDAPINFYINGIYDGEDTDMLNGSKLSIFDAGFRVPLIIKWPNSDIPKGSSSNERVNIIDIYSSLMEALNIDMLPPSEEAGDSYSFYPAWFGDVESPIRDNMVVNSYEGIRAMYVGNYKYIDGILREPANDAGQRDYMRIGGFRYENEPHEQLYRLSTDPFEDTNRINRISQEGRINDMKNLLDEIVEKGYSRPDYDFKLNTKNNKYNNPLRLIIYPNPTSKSIKVSNFTKDEYYSIYNISGAQVKVGKISNNDEINVAKLSNGLYFLKLESGTTHKFIKTSK